MYSTWLISIGTIMKTAPADKTNIATQDWEKEEEGGGQGVI